MKKHALIFAAATLFGLCQPANSADMPAKGPYYAPPPAPIFNWTGFYVGSHIGYGKAERTDLDADGFLGGLQFGYNWQISPSWVFGFEGDFTGTDINTLAAGVPVHFDYLATLRGRVGYTWDRTMLYGTAGFSYGRMGSLGTHFTENGYALGAGIEWAFAPGWSAKAEYMYHEFGDGFSIFDTTVQTIKFGVNYRFGL